MKVAPMNRLNRAVSTAITFGLTAPIFATLGFFALAFFFSPGEEFAVTGTLLGAVWLLPFAYILVLAPAALSGAFLGVFPGPASGWRFILAAGGAGALVASGIGFFDADEPGFSEGVANLAAIGAVSGLLSGTTSSFLHRRRAKARTDPSGS